MWVARALPRVVGRPRCPLLVDDAQYTTWDIPFHAPRDGAGHVHIMTRGWRVEPVIGGAFGVVETFAAPIGDAETAATAYAFEAGAAALRVVLGVVFDPDVPAHVEKAVRPLAPVWPDLRANGPHAGMVDRRRSCCVQRRQCMLGSRAGKGTKSGGEKKDGREGGGEHSGDWQSGRSVDGVVVGLL